jgi:hypothetical protein
VAHFSFKEPSHVAVSQTIPADACAGTYTVTTLVKNALGVVVSKHTTTFKIDPATQRPEAPRMQGKKARSKAGPFSICESLVAALARIEFE